MEMDSLARSPKRAKLKISSAPRTRKYPPTWPVVAGMSSRRRAPTGHLGEN